MISFKGTRKDVKIESQKSLLKKYVFDKVDFYINELLWFEYGSIRKALLFLLVCPIRSEALSRFIT